MKLLKQLLLLVLIAWVPVSFAELAVIVHKDNKDAMDANYLQMIFLGKAKGFPSRVKRCHWI